MEKATKEEATLMAELTRMYRSVCKINTRLQTLRGVIIGEAESSSETPAPSLDSVSSLVYNLSSEIVQVHDQLNRIENYVGNRVELQAGIPTGRVPVGKMNRTNVDLDD